MDYTLTDHEHALLTGWRDHGPVAEARRAAIILLSASGMMPAAIAAELDLGTSTVGRWRREWQKRGLDIFPSLTADAQPAPAPDPEIEVAPAEEAIPEPEPGIDVPRLDLTLADEVGMHPDDAMAEAGRKALHFHFERMLLHEPGTRLGENIEALHKMRVATRRMRSFFRLFRPFFKRDAIKPFEHGLRDTCRALGLVRDLDVLMEQAQAYHDAYPDADLNPMVDAWEKRRLKARLKLIAYLDRKTFKQFVRDFNKFLSKPGRGAQPLPKPGKAVPYQVRHIAPHLIYQHYEAVRAYEPVLNSTSIETLHALRIDFKRFRYVLEGFQDVLGPEAAQVIAVVKQMQDHLGDLNDTDVAIGVLTVFVDGHQAQFSGIPGFMRPDIGGVQQYIDAQRTEQDQLLATFAKAWAAFTAEAVRRDLALAVAAL